MSDFQWIKERFDKVDSDNQGIKDDLACIRRKVDRHGVYWDIAKWAVPSALASFAAWLGFEKHNH